MKLVAKIAIGAAALGLPLAAYAGTSHENEAQERAVMAHAPKPPITTSQAERIAMNAARGGKIVDSEYEQEGGGWRYSFDIRQNKRIHEIGVDANSGAIVEDKFEGLHDKD